MTQLTRPIEILQWPCPICGGTLTPPYPVGGKTVCPKCRWTGDAFLFKRLPIAVTAAESALPEDSACIHHPTKKATAICAGSGDYICSLCAIDVDGQTFSAEFLNKNKLGKAKLGKAFDRYLPRPDSHIFVLIVCSIFVPYVDFVLLAGACFWIPYAFHLYFKALRLRRENELFNRVMPKSRVVTIPIYLSLIGLGWVAGVICLVVVLLTRR